MSETQRIIVTAQPEFLQAALDELEQLDEQFTCARPSAPGITLCETPDAPALMQQAANQHPIFVRHLAPAQAIVPLSNTERDIGALTVAIGSLPEFELLEKGRYFAVQARMVQSTEAAAARAYSSGIINRTLAGIFSEETGAIENIKKPQIVVSILCTTDQAYVGISSVSENLSAWPGGARQYAQKSDQISRAEFKLQEALETFGVTLPDGGRSLDLGAAPGGWTRLMLAAGMHVVAVDPANLDLRLNGQKRLEHYRGYAQDYLEKAISTRQHFDVIANDMRMDARDAARLLGHAAQCLRPDGFVITTLKLPHETMTMRPLAIVRQAVGIMRDCYSIVQVRQLYHNRQEVTAIAAHPTGKRK